MMEGVRVFGRQRAEGRAAMPTATLVALVSWTEPSDRRGNGDASLASASLASEHCDALRLSGGKGLIEGWMRGGGGMGRKRRMAWDGG